MRAVTGTRREFVGRIMEGEMHVVDNGIVPVDYRGRIGASASPYHQWEKGYSQWLTAVEEPTAMAIYLAAGEGGGDMTVQDRWRHRMYLDHTWYYLRHLLFVWI